MAELSYKLTYQLKQQTPMLHFQYEQSGATLRVTEVKPKLDRFLISKLGGGEYEAVKKEVKEAHAEWFIGDTFALNYKMQINATGEKEVSEFKRYTDEALKALDRDERNRLRNNARSQINGMYFGNQGDSEKYKETVFYRDPIDLSVSCFIPELRKMINKHIAEFFAVTNFGTRQTKGFGGFSLLINGNEPIDENNIIFFLQEHKYLFFYAEEINDDPMQIAKAIYTSMKTGINMPNRGNTNRVKGYLLYEYLHDNKIVAGSDKTMMVEELLPNGTPHRKDQYYFVRALLGLTDHYDFRFQNGRGNNTVTVSVEGKDNGIERFPSPVTIKIIGQQVIFIFDENMFKKICGKKFTFSANGKKRDIAVPESIDVKKFIDDYVYYHNLCDEGYAGDEYLPCHIKNITEFRNSYVRIKKGWD